ncbi:hypothetical protein GE061_000431 [Apolygus lucorum]|uniref:Uncharacterized protein n=1 Tax=Apolygus lucorum TaxID=248454 RepID=A0A8S9Y4K8_APOLU|nr:hypothetical protein GE061_000431 [Apolygus lucorum]
MALSLLHDTTVAGIGEGLGNQIMKEEKTGNDRANQFHMSLLSGGQMLSSFGPLALHGPLLRAAPLLQWSAEQMALSRTVNNNNNQRAKNGEEEPVSPPLNSGKNTAANRERQRRHHLVHHKCQQEEEQRKSSRKPKEVRRVIREPMSALLSLPTILPEQTEPEDLSMSTGIKNNNYKNNNNNSSASSEGEPDELSDSWEDMS